MSNDVSLEFKTIQKNWGKYKGHIVLVINDKIIATKKPSQVKKYIIKIEKEYHRRPLIVHIPKADSLILMV